MTLDSWVIIGLISTAVVFAFGQDPREPVRARIRKIRHPE